MFLMARTIELHPDNPQPRLIAQAADVVRGGGVIAFPTDSGYALGCAVGDKSAIERIRAIRGVDEKHMFTLMCRDLSEIATYARVGNVEFRFLKQYTPGAYTFILRATHEVPRRLQHPKRKTVGLRIPNHRMALALLETMGEPLLTNSLILAGESEPLCDAGEIEEKIGKRIDLILDVGFCADRPTTIIDMSGEYPVLIRRGRGEVPAGVEETE